LITHNTAILGILGVGKSFLALELVERIINEDIKVICLDLTNQYKSELSPHYSVELAEPQIERLKGIGEAGKENVQQNVEEGGSLLRFKAQVLTDLRGFLASNNTNRCVIYNPSDFEVWRQDSKPYNNQASMASLTPVEITRIFTVTG